MLGLEAPERPENVFPGRLVGAFKNEEIAHVYAPFLLIRAAHSEQHTTLLLCRINLQKHKTN